MDTISSDTESTETSYLPIAALIAALLALVLAGVALFQISGLRAGITKQNDKMAQVDKIGALEDEVRKASVAADNASKAATKAQSSVNGLAGDIQGAFDNVAAGMKKLREDVTVAMESPRASSSPTSSSSSSGPAVAGPGEYLVKPGDTGTKIAKSLGVSWGDLLSVNPGVDWNRLGVGQKLKVPKK